jgi:hypothetical protein
MPNSQQQQRVQRGFKACSPAFTSRLFAERNGVFIGANGENRKDATNSPPFPLFPPVERLFRFNRTQLDGDGQIDLISPARWMAAPMARPNNFSAINGKVCL